MTTQPTEIEARTALSLLESGEGVVVDVREPDEFAREHIRGAANHPLSSFDPGAAARTGGKRLILQCKSGRRSGEALARVNAAGYGGAATLVGGLDAWKAAGLPVVTDLKMPIPIMRQVQLVAGSVVLAGSVLAWLVSSWFLVLPAFFGAGLVVAGATGTCGLASVLGIMPWNRAFKASAPSCPVNQP